MKLKLPKDMLLGVATAAVQIEGGDTNNDWYVWSTTGTHIKDGTNTLRANDHYNLYKQDIDLMEKLNIQTYRFGIEWARLQPAEGEWSEEAVNHYRSEINYMLSKNIKPLLTLHHFSSPIWFAEKGGFEHAENLKYFDEYVSRAVSSFGDLVSEYITINEPNVYSLMSYVDGQWTPGVKSLKRGFKVMSNMAAAHIAAYKTIHRIRNEMNLSGTRVSFANHLAYFEPLHKFNPFGRIISRILESLFQLKLTKAFNAGKFSSPLKSPDSGIKKGKYYDFNAINYYTRKTVKGFSVGDRGGNAPSNDLGWELYPLGLAKVAKYIHKHYPSDIYITENGTCDHADNFRSKYVYDHLKAVIDSGLPVKRYYYWSFMDNFEWIEGEKIQFGLIKCKYSTQERIIRPSGYFYSEIIKNKGVTDEMYAKYVEKK